MRKKLQGKIGENDIFEVCFMTQGKENDHRKEKLYQLTFDEDDRVAFNALHVLSHFDLANNEWLYRKHNNLIDRVMNEKHVGKRRLMLNLLLRQPFEEASLRSDFIDFCIAMITDCPQPYAIRAYCIKLARTNEILSRTPRRTKDGIGDAGTRDFILRFISAKRQIMNKI